MYLQNRHIFTKLRTVTVNSNEYRAAEARLLYDDQFGPAATDYYYTHT